MSYIGIDMRTLVRFPVLMSISASDRAGLIASAGERIGARRPQERDWFASWEADYHGAAAAGDEDGCELLLDVLVAYDAFQSTQRPTRLHRIA